MAKRKKIVAGVKFGILTVLGAGLITEGQSTTVCMCNCGKIITVRNYGLFSGNTKSCGCLKKDMDIQQSKDFSEKLRLKQKDFHDRVCSGEKGIIKPEFKRDYYHYDDSRTLVDPDFDNELPGL